MTENLRTIVDAFWHRGWVRVPAVYDAQAVRSIAELASAFASSIAAEAVSHERANICDVDEEGRLFPRKLDFPYLRHLEFRAFILAPRLQAVLKAVLGMQSYLVRDHSFMKPPRCGSAKPFHQDNAHMMCEPVDQVITAWIALDEATEANGCMQYLDGSHRGGTLPHNISPERPYNVEPVSTHVLNRFPVCHVCALPGDVLLHHALTFHASGSNATDRWRRGYASHWVGRGVRSANDTLKWAYSETVGEGLVQQRAP